MLRAGSRCQLPPLRGADRTPLLHACRQVALVVVLIAGCCCQLPAAPRGSTSTHAGAALHCCAPRHAGMLAGKCRLLGDQWPAASWLYLMAHVVAHARRRLSAATREEVMDIMLSSHAARWQRCVLMHVVCFGNVARAELSTATAPRGRRNES